MVDPLPSGAGAGAGPASAGASADSSTAAGPSPGPAGDVIELRGLRVLGVCGVLPEEQVRPQPLLVDLDVAADLAAAGRSDDLADTLDYGAIADEVARVAGTERFALLERLAARIAEVVLADERVRSVQVAVRKLRPPVAQLLDTSGVRITRSR